VKAKTRRQPKVTFWLFWSVGCLLAGAGCATSMTGTEWITIGKTTRADVIERHGPPDLVRIIPEGELATYGPPSDHTARPLVQVQTIQPGPEGKFTTQTQPVIPGLGVRPIGSGTDGRPRKALNIRYDLSGVVRDIVQ
jgi:hypothetical protein